jgi:hypothetical protein
MNRSTVFVALSVLLLQAGSALADARSKAAAEVAEWVARKFGKETIKEGVEAFSKRLASSAARHGDEVFAAVRRIGPRGLHAVEEAGEHGGKVARLIVGHGDDAVVWVAKRPTGMALLARHGESAGAALCRHKAVAEPLIERLGEPAVQALAKVGPQSGRRLAIMAESGELARIGRSEQLLGVVGKLTDELPIREEAAFTGATAVTGAGSVVFFVRFFFRRWVLQFETWDKDISSPNFSLTNS